MFDGSPADHSFPLNCCHYTVTAEILNLYAVCFSFRCIIQWLSNDITQYKRGRRFVCDYTKKNSEKFKCHAKDYIET